MTSTNTSLNDLKPVVFYDGYCNLCSGVVQFVIRRGGGSKFRFVPLQDFGESARYGVMGDPEPGSVALFEGGKVWYKSDALIGICRILGFPWSLAVSGKLIPRILRDKMYEIVAANRIRWFGKRTSCYFPDKDDLGH